jgi:phosphatidate cytidylyltransferase
MLRTRLWMGTVLILLTVGVLLGDAHLAWYPFLFAVVFLLSMLGTHELLNLLGPSRRPWPILCYASVAALVVVNWLPHVCPFARTFSSDPFRWVFGVYVGVIIVGFLAAMASFQPDAGVGNDTLSRLSLLLLATAYLGVLPSFLAQLRWPLSARLDDPNRHAVLSLALAIFIPKCCDIGAYTAGRLFGKHKMSPVLSPKKTWEGLAGGLVVAMAAAVGLNSFGPVLPGILPALGFGLTVGGAGVLGDLAESLIKRECRQKDASQVMPGFGGVLDVIDSIVYAAPIAYLWLA